MYGARTNNHRKKTGRQIFFFFLAKDLSPTFLNTWAKMKPSRNLESKTSWNISGNVCMKGQAHSSSELALEKKTKKTRRLWRTKVRYDLLYQLRSCSNITQFRISSRKKSRQRDTGPNLNTLCVRQPHAPPLSKNYKNINLVWKGQNAFGHLSKFGALFIHSYITIIFH